MLQEFAERRARHCSGGVRRRLNLGIALLQEPEVLLLDEPTVGVDPQSRAFLLDRVRDMVAGGTAVLYATHYMEEVSALCSHILLLDHGQVLASGDLATLLRGPAGSAPFEHLEALFMHYTHRPLRD
jgi:ABC-2 type transport system ATP-binding protein